MFEELRPRAVRTADSPAAEVARLPLQSLSEYFLSHPPADDRIAALEREILAHGWDASKPTRPLEVPE
jgi:Zn-dependent protease with chaperone function